MVDVGSDRRTRLHSQWENQFLRGENVRSGDGNTKPLFRAHEHVTCGGRAAQEDGGTQEAAVLCRVLASERTTRLEEGCWECSCSKLSQS